MAINLSDNLRINSSLPVDNRFGPYSGATEAIAKAAANAAIDSGVRFQGLTVGLIIGGADVVEYWYAGGTLDTDLIEKTDGVGTTSGTSGSDGTSGTSGSDGTSGTSGSDGTSGTSGSDGTSGTSGSDGTSGTSGSDGTSGTSGTSGSDGTSGTSGSDGTSGTSGVDGTSGTSGSDGTSGTSGVNGTSGTSGADGTSGTSGADGTSGTSGADGTSGTSGSDGTSGTSGVDGTSGTSGADGTSGTSGADGTSGTSGSDGTSGTSGVNGTSGTSGADGTSGTSGADGTSGTSGADGTSGTSGVDGTSGTSGADGTSGTSGSDGTSGTSGADGTSGTSGADGTSGTSGADGTSGTSGVDGTSGTSGSDGTSGTSGSDGTSGTSGVDGTSGTSGVDGTSGTSGVDGTSGTSGVDGLPQAIEGTSGLQLNGSNELGTIFNSALDINLTMPFDVGGIPAGTTVGDLATYNLVDLWNDLLFPTVLPTYEIPTNVLNWSNISSTVEIGTTINPDFIMIYDANDAGAPLTNGMDLTRAVTGSVSSNGTTTINTSTPGYITSNYQSIYNGESYTIPSASINSAAVQVKYKSLVDYGAGVAKNDNKGNLDTRPFAVRQTDAPQSADNDFGSNTRTVNGYYPYFYGTDSSTHISTMTAVKDAIETATYGNGAKVVASGAGELTLNVGTSQQFVWFAVPSGHADKTQWFETSLNYGDISQNGNIASNADLFTKLGTTSIDSPEGYWTNIDYDIYVQKESNSGSAFTTGSFKIS